MDPGKEKYSHNQKAWNLASKHFVGTGALPSWGALGEGKDIDLMEIPNKRFLEIGCGTGHSIQYLMQNNAKEVIGIDISEEQLKEAGLRNQEYINSKNVSLYLSPMEKIANLNLKGKFDYVFSIYGLGWCTNLDSTLSVLRGFLKKDGKLIFSFEHPIYALTEYTNNSYSFKQEYGDFDATLINWLGTNTDAYITYRTPETWFKALKKAGFDSIEYFEPRPVLSPESIDDYDLRTYYIPEKYNYVPLTMLFVCR